MELLTQNNSNDAEIKKIKLVGNIFRWLSILFLVILVAGYFTDVLAIFSGTSQKISLLSALFSIVAAALVLRGSAWVLRYKKIGLSFISAGVALLFVESLYQMIVGGNSDIANLILIYVLPCGLLFYLYKHQNLLN